MGIGKARQAGKQCSGKAGVQLKCLHGRRSPTPLPTPSYLTPPSQSEMREREGEVAGKECKSRRIIGGWSKQNKMCVQCSRVPHAIMQCLKPVAHVELHVRSHKAQGTGGRKVWPPPCLLSSSTSKCHTRLLFVGTVTLKGRYKSEKFYENKECRHAQKEEMIEILENYMRGQC